MSYTFRVSDVDRGDYTDSAEESVDALRRTLREDAGGGFFVIEDQQSSRPSDYLTVGVSAPVRGYPYHPFLASATLAFCEHLPFCFSPDHIWALISQGIGFHISQNPDVGAALVGHRGQLTIQAYDDDVLDPEKADIAWRAVLEQITSQIDARVPGDIMPSLCDDFSTTGPIERAVFRAAAMNAFQQYFSYLAISGCGIPHMTLEGTPEDWEALYRRARALTKHGLDWWWEVLEPVLRELLNASKGTPNRGYWRSFVKSNGESGGPYWTGWIVYFFPYVNYKYRDPGERICRNNLFDVDVAAVLGSDQSLSGLTEENFLPPISNTPVTWKVFGQIKRLELLAGFFGSSQLEDGTIRPELGYAIRYAPEQPAVHL